MMEEWAIAAARPELVLLLPQISRNETIYIAWRISQLRAHFFI